jgi:hypothetical protein
MQELGMVGEQVTDKTVIRMTLRGLPVVFRHVKEFVIFRIVWVIDSGATYHYLTSLPVTVSHRETGGVHLKAPPSKCPVCFSKKISFNLANWHQAKSTASSYSTNAVHRVGMYCHKMP